MSRGESTIGLLTCIWRFTMVKSSWELTADMKEVLETEWVSDESRSTVKPS